MKKFLILLFLLSLISVWPFFKKGYFESHDGEWMIIRFSAFHQTLRNGQFPVRYTERLNNNYGYPVLNFLYPLPFYAAEIPKVAGFNFTDSIKIIFVATTIASALIMFWALSQVFGFKAAFGGSILYLFTPYRFVDLYVRGSLGENFAFALLPLVLGCVFKISKNKGHFIPVLSVSIALLIIAHNVIALIFLPFFLIQSLILIKKDRLKIVRAFALGILVSTFFWLPALYDLKYVRLSQIKVSEVADHLVPVRNLVVPSWGYGPTPGGQNGLSTQIGIVSLFVFASVVFLAFFKHVKDKFVYFYLAVFVISIFLMTNFSLPIWQKVPGLDVIQFPWRLLSLVVFCSSLLLAYLLNFADKKNVLVSIIVVSAISSTFFYIKPVAFVERPDSYYATNEDTTTVRDEYLPLWVKEKSQRSSAKIELLDPGEIVTKSEKTLNYQAKIKSDEGTGIQVNTIYFPDFQVFVDNQKASFSYNNEKGFINFQLPKGEHEVIIKYIRSPVHLASELLSLGAIFIVGIYFLKSWQK